VRHITALKVRRQSDVNAGVHGRARGGEVEVAASDVAEHGIGHSAVCAQRELGLATGVQVVVFVEGAISVTDLLHRLDDVVPHHQDAAVAPGVANEALAARAGHDNRVIEKAGVCHRAKAVLAAPRDDECGSCKGRADDVVREGVVARPRVTEFAERVVIDGEVVVNVVPLPAVDFDCRAVASVIVREGVASGD